MIRTLGCRLVLAALLLQLSLSPDLDLVLFLYQKLFLFLTLPANISTSYYPLFIHFSTFIPLLILLPSPECLFPPSSSEFSSSFRKVPAQIPPSPKSFPVFSSKKIASLPCVPKGEGRRKDKQALNT